MLEKMPLSPNSRTTASRWHVTDKTSSFVGRVFARFGVKRPIVRVLVLFGIGVICAAYRRLLPASGDCRRAIPKLRAQPGVPRVLNPVVDRCHAANRAADMV